MRRFFHCLVLVSLLFAAPVPASADSNAPDPEPDALCTAEYQLSHPGQCSLYGPGGYAERRRLYDLPATLPPLATLPLKPLTPLLTHTYAKVTTPEAPVF